MEALYVLTTTKRSMVAVEDFMMRLDDPHSLMVLLLLLPIHFVGTYLSGLRARLMSYRI